DAVAVQDFSTRDEGIDGAARADHGCCRVAERFGVFIDDDATVVDEEYMLEEHADLVDQVGRQHDGARMLGVVLEEAVVEDLSRDGVEAQVRLIEEREGSARGEPDDDADRGELPAGELLDAPVGRQAEVVDELLRELGVPVLEEPGGALEDVLDVEVLRVALALLDEADVPQHAGVLDG